MHSIYQAFIASGVIGYAIFVIWVILVALIMERTVFWIKIYANKDSKSRNKIIELVKAGKHKEAKVLASKSWDIALKVVGNFLPEIPKGQDFDLILSRVESVEMKDIYCGTSLFNIIAAIASPIGLFGTVVGLTKSFGSYAASADMSVIGIGISLAMSTTYLALAIVIITLISNYVFNSLSKQWLEDINYLLNSIRLAKSSHN